MKKRGYTINEIGHESFTPLVMPATFRVRQKWVKNVRSFTGAFCLSILDTNSRTF